MELRKLKALLGALKDAGVTSFKEGDLTLEFGATLQPVPTGEVEGLEQDWTQGTPTGLQQAYNRIQAQYKPKQKGRAS